MVERGQWLVHPSNYGLIGGDARLQRAGKSLAFPRGFCCFFKTGLSRNWPIPGAHQMKIGTSLAISAMAQKSSIHLPPAAIPSRQFRLLLEKIYK